MKKVLSLFLAFVLVITPLNSFAQEATEMTTTRAAVEIKALMDFILDKYAGDEIDEEQLYEAALKGIFESLDKYSTVYNEDEYDEYYTEISGEYGGIGAVILMIGDNLNIVSVLPDSPAEKSKLKAKDTIIKVNGQALKDLNQNEAIEKIKGKIGTPVKLTILREDKTFDVTVVREKITQNAVTAKPLSEMFPDEKNRMLDKTWYINIESFNLHVAEDFKAVLQKAKKAGVKGLIIDVRNNPGGFLDQVVKVCRQIVPKGPIVHTIAKDSDTIETKSSNLAKSPFEMVVLANGGSASASEIFVGAIKDSEAGIIVGEKTYGKGVVQKMYDIGNMKFKMTIEEYLTRNKNHINKIGIEPDIEVVIPRYVPKLNDILTVGYKGEEVKAIEAILQYLGYDINKPDNNYDEETYEAVKKFSDDHNLSETGLCDNTFVRNLNQAIFDSVQEYDPQLDKAKKIIQNVID